MYSVFQLVSCVAFWFPLLANAANKQTVAAEMLQTSKPMSKLRHDNVVQIIISYIFPKRS